MSTRFGQSGLAVSRIPGATGTAVGTRYQTRIDSDRRLSNQACFQRTRIESFECQYRAGAMSVIEHHVLIQSRPLNVVPDSIRIEIRDFIAQLIGEEKLASVRYVSAGYLLVPDDPTTVNFKVDVNVAAGVPSRIDCVEFNDAPRVGNLEAAAESSIVR